MADECECLVLGPSGVGKTVLLKKLRSIHDERTSKKVVDEVAKPVSGILAIPTTVPTSGTNYVTLPSSHKNGVRPILLKEYGGCMAPLWPKALFKTHQIVYVVDANNPMQLSVAMVLLLDLLGNEVIVDKPVLLFFNKTDLPGPMSLNEVQEIMRVNDLRVQYGEKLAVLSGSCVTGDGLMGVTNWIRTAAQGTTL